MPEVTLRFLPIRTSLCAVIIPTESILVTSSYVNVPPILTLPVAVISVTVILGEPVRLVAVPEVLPVTSPVIFPVTFPVTLPVTFPVTFPVTAPVKGPLKVVAVIIPATTAPVSAIVTVLKPLLLVRLFTRISDDILYYTFNYIYELVV